MRPKPLLRVDAASRRHIWLEGAPQMAELGLKRSVFFDSGSDVCALIPEILPLLSAPFQIGRAHV